ncbi:MAG: glycerol-3-phosphate 1-O-acyltransferase PlsY [bacterium]|nr:glycerol-3-phosphate 1-O-acyltransferase PlsY [bacterium]
MSQHEIFFIIGCYLLGSVPFGFILYYLYEKKDIRKEGSGNIGASNVMRNKGKTAGIATLILDMLKGIAAVVYGLRHFESPTTVILGGTAVILGHLFPLYLKFKGGKGIASLLGVFLVFNLPAAAAFACLFLPTLYFTRYVSAASIAGVTAIFFITLFTHIAEVSTIVLVMTTLIIVKHRANIQRIMAGTENKFNWKENG